MSKAARFDWSQFRLGIYVQDNPDDLYDMWATSRGLTRWFLRSAAFALSDGLPSSRRLIAQAPPFESLPQRPDEERCSASDRYRWEWYYNGGVIGESWILDSRPPTKLTFGFGDAMEVELLLRKQGKLCEIALRQYHIPDTPAGRHNLHLGSRVAWAFFLANLKSVAEGGLDLRETDRPRTRQLHLVNI